MSRRYNLAKVCGEVQPTFEKISCKETPHNRAHNAAMPLIE
uniref:Uncharacterized protein n=1 Tax=Anguilla anguilla TaxID=7936 RepID=A0A0E9R3A5_ANGAN